jgi:hypothetical protein
VVDDAVWRDEAVVFLPDDAGESASLPRKVSVIGSGGVGDALGLDEGGFTDQGDEALCGTGDHAAALEVGGGGGEGAPADGAGAGYEGAAGGASATVGGGGAAQGAAADGA